MRKILAAIVLFGLINSSLYASEGTGMMSVASAHSVGVTADRLEKILASKGMKVFTRINHAAGAASVGKELRPTELVIFGNPKVGAPLMQCSQSIAIDLPQKALIWEDANGEVWISYNDPQYLAARHNTQGCDAVLKKVEMALGMFAKKAGAAE